MALSVGSSATRRHRVTASDTAAALGSGAVEVLATPRLLALMEAATVQAVAADLEPGQTSVGTRVQLEHLRPSAVGVEVVVHARLVEHDERRLRFEVVAEHGDGTVVASAVITRSLVGLEQFHARAQGR
ncbi:MAG: thioesterase family protein [Sporichthyaceae bacterium]